MPRLALALALCACARNAAPSTAAPETGVVLADMDRKAQPCDDFYEFANGAWRAANPIPASMERWSRRWQAGEENKKKLQLILDELAGKKWPQGSADQLAGDFYSACMDEGRADAQGLSPLAPMLAEIDAIQTRAELNAEIRRLEELGLNAPFSFGSEPDPHEPARTIADTGAGGLGMPDRDYYLKPEKRFVEAREKYQQHLQKMFALMGVADESGKVFAFEKRLAEASLDNVALRDPQATDHPSPFAALAQAAPHFDWQRYFEEGKIARAALNIEEPKFLAQLDHELAETPLEDWRAWLRWQLVDAAAPWLSKPFVDEAFDFDQRYLEGIGEMKPRGVRCAQLTDSLLGEALGQKYVERYFPPQAKARVQEMVRNELAAMREIVQGLDWMSAGTKARALHKIETFNPKAGYPDKWKDYAGVEVRPDALLANIVSARKYATHFTHALIGKPTDRSLWGLTPPTSNAYYNPLLNEIVFPAGILQPPAFDLDASDAVNYGAIGVVIGHEISHGFDDQGAQYDADGRLQNWWTADDLSRFKARAQCVVEQFDGYFIEPGIHHDGKLVLGESIGDLAGARVAYTAYQNALKEHPETPRDGFSPEQEFFIAWGQFRGDATRPEAQRKMIQGDPHPVARFRVLGPLSNLPEFAQAFRCPADAPMVRKTPCRVW